MDTSIYSAEEIAKLILEAYAHLFGRFLGDADFCRLQFQYLHALVCINRGTLPSCPADQLEFAEQMREWPLWIEENSDDEADAFLAHLMLHVVEKFRAPALDALGLHAGAKEARVLRDEHFGEAISRLRCIGSFGLRPQGVGAEDPAARDAGCADGADAGMSDES